MDVRHAEHRHHRITDELLDDPSVTLDSFASYLEVAREDAAAAVYDKQSFGSTRPGPPAGSLRGCGLALRPARRRFRRAADVSACGLAVRAPTLSGSLDRIDQLADRRALGDAACDLRLETVWGDAGGGEQDHVRLRRP